MSTHSHTRTPHEDISASTAATIAAAVAAALGPDWTVGPRYRDGDHQPLPYHRTPIAHKDGYSFDLSFDGYRNEGRIEVSANYPKTRDGRESYPHGGDYDPRAPAITVARTTPPAKIAQAIRSRFLPGYLPIWAKQLERLNGDNARADQTERTVLELIAQGHGKRGYHSHQANVVYAGQDSHVYQLTADGEDVRFEHFSCPLAVALAILPLLRKGSSKPEPTNDEDVCDTIRELCDECGQGPKGRPSNLHTTACSLHPANTVESRQERFEAHRQADPHCTCNDCLDYHEAQMHAAELEAEAERTQAEREAGSGPYTPDDGPQDTRDLS